MRATAKSSSHYGTRSSYEKYLNEASKSKNLTEDLLSLNPMVVCQKYFRDLF